MTGKSSENQISNTLYNEPDGLNGPLHPNWGYVPHPLKAIRPNTLKKKTKKMHV